MNHVSFVELACNKYYYYLDYKFVCILFVFDFCFCKHVRTVQASSIFDCFDCSWQQLLTSFTLADCTLLIFGLFDLWFSCQMLTYPYACTACFHFFICSIIVTEFMFTEFFLLLLDTPPLFQSPIIIFISYSDFYFPLIVLLLVFYTFPQVYFTNSVSYTYIFNYCIFESPSI